MNFTLQNALPDYFHLAMFHPFFKMLILNSFFGQLQLNYSLI